MNREILKLIGYDDWSVGSLNTEEWDDNYDLLPPRTRITENDEIWMINSRKWVKFSLGYTTTMSDIARRLKPGLEKVKVTLC